MTAPKLLAALATAIILAATACSLQAPERPAPTGRAPTAPEPSPVTITDVRDDCTYPDPAGGPDLRADLVAVQASPSAITRLLQSKYADFQEYGHRHQEPSTILRFPCGSLKRLYEYYQYIMLTKGFQDSQPYLPSSRDIDPVELHHRHPDPEAVLLSFIDLRVSITQRDGTMRDLHREDLPHLSVTSSDESVLAPNPQGHLSIIGMGYADVVVTLGQATLEIPNIPVHPLAVDDQCRFWSPELPLGFNLPPGRHTHHYDINPVFTARSPVSPDDLRTIQRQGGWNTFKLVAGPHYQATTGIDCRTHPRQAVAASLRNYHRTRDILLDLPTGNFVDNQSDAVQTGTVLDPRDPPPRNINLSPPPDPRVDLPPRCTGELDGVPFAADQIVVRLRDGVQTPTSSSGPSPPARPSGATSSPAHPTTAGTSYGPFAPWETPGRPSGRWTPC